MRVSSNRLSRCQPDSVGTGSLVSDVTSIKPPWPAWPFPDGPFIPVPCRQATDQVGNAKFGDRRVLLDQEDRVAAQQERLRGIDRATDDDKRTIDGRRPRRNRAREIGKRDEFLVRE